MSDDGAFHYQEAHALANRTRYSIFLELAAAPRDVQQLANRFELAPNSVRHHLAELLAAGLVEQRVLHRRVRGRPRHLYSVTDLGRRWLDPPRVPSA